MKVIINYPNISSSDIEVHSVDSTEMRYSLSICDEIISWSDSLTNEQAEFIAKWLKENIRDIVKIVIEKNSQ